MPPWKSPGLSQLVELSYLCLCLLELATVHMPPPTPPTITYYGNLPGEILKSPKPDPVMLLWLFPGVWSSLAPCLISEDQLWIYELLSPAYCQNGEHWFRWLRQCLLPDSPLQLPPWAQTLVPMSPVCLLVSNTCSIYFWSPHYLPHPTSSLVLVCPEHSSVTPTPL